MPTIWVNNLTLDGRTHVYSRDPLGRLKTAESTGASKPTITSTTLYADDEDTPVAISRSDNTVERRITGPSGQVLASDDDGTVTYQLRDLQGNIVATADANAGATGPSARSEYDEFGIVKTPAPNVFSWAKGVPGQGWLGGHQRTTEFGQPTVAGGPMQMGARVYLPGVGRFLQVDPVAGGSASAYDYANADPVNNVDLTGLYYCPWMEVVGGWPQEGCGLLGHEPAGGPGLPGCPSQNYEPRSAENLAR